ncbi:GIY-YIG nuclease family protein [Legionella sp. WA2024007413]
MTELSQKQILILDCQTTGMHPNTGHLLQIGWSIVDPRSFNDLHIEKWTLKLPHEAIIPPKIKRMLHLTESELQDSAEPQLVFESLQRVLGEVGPEPIIIAHYAQFEKSFLKQFYLDHGQAELNFNLICSQKIAKRLLPHLPSHNLKAVAGFLKWPNTPKNEIYSHVSMTIHVWQHLQSKLLAANVGCYASLEAWLNMKHPTQSELQYEYNIERLERLNLSTKPGIYHMLAQDKTILYIGKATSLKARVNSYFRGVKNRDRRKLEMLAQVWDIETTECDTALEAALLESDEIKKWEPPYNILLKSDNRKLIFYNYDFTAFTESKDNTFFNGPYKPHDSLMVLMELLHALKTQAAIEYREEYISPVQLKSAWRIFCAMHAIKSKDMEQLTMRTSFLIGYQLLKQFEAIHGKGSFQKWWATEKKKNLEDESVLEERIARKIARILIRAAETKRKVRMLTRLYNASFVINSTQKKLTVINGELANEISTLPLNNKLPPSFDIHHYDRLSILLSALNNKTISLL